MDDTTNVGGRDRLVRLALTVVLSILAVRWLRGGKRLRGLLAGVGALGFGFNATTGYCGVNDALDVDTTTDVDTTVDTDTTADVDTTTDADTTADDVTVDFEDDGSEDDTDEASTAGTHSLVCASCGEPIVPGQSRGPNGEGDIVHDDCE